MAELHILGGEAGQNRRADVVFVHGLDGHWRNSWNNGAQDGFWPEWLADDCPDVAIWSTEYEAAATTWRGEAMPVLDRATNLLDALLTSNVGNRPLCFVAHSMGGLLVKAMLRQASDTRAQTRRRAFLEGVRGVVFLATPHTGSNLASLSQFLSILLRPTSAARDLAHNSAQLRELNLWYRDNAQELNIQSKIYFEKVKINGLLVVDEASADPGLPHADVIPIDADHVAISKPRNRNAQVYRGTLQFIRDVLNSVPHVQLDVQPQNVASSTSQTKQGDGITVPELAATTILADRTSFDVHRLRLADVVARRKHSLIQRCLIDDVPFILKRTDKNVCDVLAIAKLVGKRYTSSDYVDDMEALRATVATPAAVLTSDAYLYEVYNQHDGITLEEAVLRSAAPIQGALLGAVFETLLGLLSHFHRDGLLYRDMSPSNVLVTIDEECWRQPLSDDYRGDCIKLTLIDCSFACRIDAPQIPVTNRTYTPPEQHLGQATAQSDWYSLAATCFFLANRRPPDRRQPAEYHAGLRNMDLGQGRLLHFGDEFSQSVFPGDDDQSIQASQSAESAYRADVETMLTIDALLQPDVTKRPRNEWLLRLHHDTVTPHREREVYGAIDLGANGWILIGDDQYGYRGLKNEHLKDQIRRAVGSGDLKGEALAKLSSLLLA
jgi:hypothetical protein